jgi:DNA-binding transcriptional LysR family regulator
MVTVQFAGGICRKRNSVVRKIDWDRQIGRRLRLRDLHIFLSVAQHGSMSRAARELRVSQPAVSDVITSLENTIGERLFDRDRRGVEPTRYGRALLQRSLVVFDELKQGIKEIELLADPTAGELRIGCVDSIASTILPQAIDGFSERYPQVAVHVDRLVTNDVDLAKLRGRSLDVVLVRYFAPLARDSSDLNIETLFQDYLVVVCGRRSRFARRNEIDLAELVNEPWILTPADTANNTILMEAFRSRGLKTPRVFLSTYSVELRVKLLATGRYVAAFARSVIQPDAERSLRILPIELPLRPWPIVLITPKHRALNPIAQRFIEHLRDCAKTMSAALAPQQSRAPTRAKSNR